METQKLKLKIGEHEFEAEGPTEVVQAQFAAFREMVLGLPARPAPVTPAVGTAAGAGTATGVGESLPLAKIMKHDGRVVSLTARGASIDDEIMLVMLGQKMLRENDSATGGEILDGLRLTGRTANRVDYQLDKMTTAGDVITVGVGRARRYRLTNQGVAKAQELAQGIIATVA